MSRIIVRPDVNQGVSFLHIANFLVAYKIMSLEETHRLYQKFKLGEDVVFDIQDQMASTFRDHLDFLNFKHE